MSDDFTLDLADENATLAFGAQFARVLVPNLTIFLQGNLGAGKTTFVRGMLHALSFHGKVKSPTYTLLESYEVSPYIKAEINPEKNLENSLKLTVNHFDLYRFNDDEEWEAAGFREAFNAQSVCMIEWPEKAINCLPQADLEIKLALKENKLNQTIGRVVTVTGLSLQGKNVQKNL